MHVHVCEFVNRLKVGSVRGSRKVLVGMCKVPCHAMASQ